MSSRLFFNVNKMFAGKFINGNVSKMLDFDISEKRLKICHECPLYTPKYGGICNERLWLNPDTGDVSSEKQVGYKNGCGCKLSFKVNNIDSKCPLDKW